MVPRGHVTVISPDDTARGGHRLACTVAACLLRREGTEAQLVGLAMDHYDETVNPDD